MKLIKPPALRPGQKIGIIAPASNIQRELLEAGIAGLRALGYEPAHSPGILEKDLYFAGPLERRLRELEEMVLRDDIAAIICARGGYGSNYLLERLDFRKFAEHPKILMGYSDNTFILTAIHERTGLITFHGPMVTKDFALPQGVELSSWEHAVKGSAAWEIPGEGAQVLRPGKCTGRLYGGCLSMLVASLGTPYEIKTEGTILFLEDIAAKPYQIDRMLMQLRLAGKLDGVEGFIFGEMIDCFQHKDQEYTLQEVIMRILQNYKKPVVYGLKSGHVSSRNITLPMGVKAGLSAEGSKVELKILEAASEIG